MSVFITPVTGVFVLNHLSTIMRSTSLSVSCMASLPIDVRLRIVLSISSLIIPSPDETQVPSMASIADITEVETPDDIFIEHAGLAPSQIIPVRFATIFFIAAHTCAKPPPIRYTRAAEAPVDATTHPQSAERRPRLCFM